MPQARWFLPALLYLFTLPCMAQAIHRCVGSDGHPVFTDQRCIDLQATPAPAGTVATASSVAAVPAAALTCAAGLDDLKQAVTDAFADHDANRLAGLMLWKGYGPSAAVADIRSLAALVRQPLVDIEPTDTEAAGATDTAPDTLVLHTATEDGSDTPHETRFAVVHRAGCLWLRQE